MRLFRQRELDDARGAAAVEFALILPVLVMLVFGIIAFGLVYFQWQGLQASAREGARLGSLTDTDAGDINDRVESALQGVPFDATPTTTVTPEPCQDPGTPSVEVLVEADVQFSIPLVGDFSPTLRGIGDFRCEGFEG